MSLVSILERGRRDFVSAIAASGSRPASPGWTAVECIDHAVLFEQRYQAWLECAADAPYRRDPDRELRLFTMVRNRLEKMEAPDIFHPRGRFATIQVATAVFEEVRIRSVEIVRERGDDLYRIAMRHPYFGIVNGAELVQIIDGHCRRHADQIREGSYETCENQ